MDSKSPSNLESQSHCWYYLVVEVVGGNLSLCICSSVTSMNWGLTIIQVYRSLP